MVIEPDHSVLTIASRRMPRMSAGDTVLLLEGRNQRRFTATAIVLRVVHIQSDGADEAMFTKIELGSATALPEGLDLDALWYSLTIVRNTSRPNVHFRRGYRLLPLDDFETIRNGEPFIARTGYFELWNSLPPSLKAAFESEQILLAGGGREREGFRQRLERLYKFIDKRVLAVGRLLHALEEVAGALNLDGAPVEHWFAAETEASPGVAARPDNLAVQLRRFAGLREVLTGEAGGQSANKERDLIGDAIRRLDIPDRQPIEHRFERLFAASR